MKHLSETDIIEMIADEYMPNIRAVTCAVRRELRMGTRQMLTDIPIPTHVTLDLHNHTVEQAWEKIMGLAKSGTRHAKIITGASGVLHQLFPQWANNSVLSQYIISVQPINNGSFQVMFRKPQSN